MTRWYEPLKRWGCVWLCGGMTCKDLPNSSTAMLDELAGLTLRAARVVVAVMEVEQQAAEAVARWLPRIEADAPSLEIALKDGQALDGVAETLRAAVPRVDVLARSLERLGRSLRRTVALGRRLAAGWPRAGSADTRATMVRRAAATRVGGVIWQQVGDHEAAERLFDELDERLDDPVVVEMLASLPVDDVVRVLCRDLGLAMEGLDAAVRGGPGGVDSG